jgi:hypothetical protein
MRVEQNCGSVLITNVSTHTQRAHSLLSSSPHQPRVIVQVFQRRAAWSFVGNG